MTQKANANQQPTVKFFRGERHVAGRAAVAVPQLRRVSRHAWHSLADAILIPGSGDVNFNLDIVPSALAEGTSGGNPTVVTFWAATAEQADLGKTGFAAAYDDEDEEEDEDNDLDDDDLDEDDDEDLGEDDDEDYEDDDDLDDEDLDDDDLGDDEDDEDEDDE